MKKILGTLLLLLALLIGTCVYQKTYSIYALTHTDDENMTQIPEKQPKPLLNTSINTVQTKKMPSETPVPPHVSTKVISEAVSTQQRPDKPSDKKEPTIFEKIKTSVMSVVSTDNEEKNNDTPKIDTSDIKTKNTQDLRPNASTKTVDTEVKEKEVVDYLLTVLKERETTLANRDEVENKLQTLIKKVLKNRQAAIENMEKQTLTVQKEHNERLKNRDKTAEDIYKKYTEKQGK